MFRIIILDNEEYDGLAREGFIYRPFEDRLTTIRGGDLVVFIKIPQDPKLLSEEVGIVKVVEGTITRSSFEMLRDYLFKEGYIGYNDCEPAMLNSKYDNPHPVIAIQYSTDEQTEKDKKTEYERLFKEKPVITLTRHVKTRIMSPDGEQGGLLMADLNRLKRNIEVLATPEIIHDLALLIRLREGGLWDEKANSMSMLNLPERVLDEYLDILIRQSFVIPRYEQRLHNKLIRLMGILSPPTDGEDPDWPETDL